jgi:hypothetical protein
MAARESEFRIWEAFWQRVESFGTALARYKAQNVNAAGLREQARELVSTFFNQTRPVLQRRGVANAATEALENDLLHLVELASGKNSKASYRKLIRHIRGRRKKIETGLEFLIGVENPVIPSLSPVERAILQTLEEMIPSAGASYKQLLLDLQQKGRASYRGTAAELREVVREVLDILAPDNDVMAAPGFTLEAGHAGPTMAQKVRFILKARKVTVPARGTAEAAAEIVDQSVATLGRSVYTRGAMNVHTARTLHEVQNFKMYADAVLGELLEIHKPIEAAGENVI